MMEQKQNSPHFEYADLSRRTSRRVDFVDPDRGLRENVLDDCGFFARFPGIANPALLEPYCPVPSGRVRVEYGFAFQPMALGTWRMLWTIHPDGRYWADEDDFGWENDTEVELYAPMDNDGKFLASFRIYQIGGTCFEGTDLEEREARALAERTAALDAARASGMTDVEILRSRVVQSLRQFSEAPETWPTEACLDVAGISTRGFVANLRLQEFPAAKSYGGEQKTVEWSYRIGVRQGNYGSTESTCRLAHGTQEEVLSYLKSERSVGETLSYLKCLCENF